MPRKACPPYLLLICAVALLSGAAFAEEGANEPPWCLTEHAISGREYYGPDGAITRIGNEFLRICQRGSSSPPERRTVRFTVNPDRVPGLVHDDAMIGLIVGPRPLDYLFQETRDMFELVAERNFGGHTYAEYHRYSERLQRWVDGRRFIFEPSEEDEQSKGIPRHVILCGSDLRKIETDVTHCWLYVEYRDLNPRMVFIGGGPHFPPSALPIDQFAVYAADVVRILDTARVDGEEEIRALGLPFIE